MVKAPRTAIYVAFLGLGHAFAQAQSPSDIFNSAVADKKLAFSPTCHRSNCPVPDFRRLWMAPTVLPGVSGERSCRLQQNLKVAQFNRKLSRETRAAGGSPKFCGIVYDNYRPLEICTRG